MSNKESVKLDDEQIELCEIFHSSARSARNRAPSISRRSSGRPTPIATAWVEFSEFVALVSPELLPAKSPYTEEQLKQLLRMFNRDGNGFITAAKLAHSMARLGHALTTEELRGMIKEVDTDSDGRISFWELS